MSEALKTWNVVSNSFGKSSFTITGENFLDALKDNAELIFKSAVPSVDRWKLIEILAEWQPFIIKGRGGVEVEVRARYTLDKNHPIGHFILWVDAQRNEIGKKTSLKFN